MPVNKVYGCGMRLSVSSWDQSLLYISLTQYNPSEEPIVILLQCVNIFNSSMLCIVLFKLVFMYRYLLRTVTTNVGTVDGNLTISADID